MSDDDLKYSHTPESKAHAAHVRVLQQRITLLETQVATLRVALEPFAELGKAFQAKMDACSNSGTDEHDKLIVTYSWLEFKQILRVKNLLQAVAALAASPEAKPNCETCGKPHPCWCPAPDARPAAKEKQ